MIRFTARVAVVVLMLVMLLFGSRWLGSKRFNPLTALIGNQTLPQHLCWLGICPGLTTTQDVSKIMTVNSSEVSGGVQLPALRWCIPHYDLQFELISFQPARVNGCIAYLNNVVVELDFLFDSPKTLTLENAIDLFGLPSYVFECSYVDNGVADKRQIYAFFEKAYALITIPDVTNRGINRLPISPFITLDSFTLEPDNSYRDGLKKVADNYAASYWVDPIANRLPVFTDSIKVGYGGRCQLGG